MTRFPSDLFSMRGSVGFAANSLHSPVWAMEYRKGASYLLNTMQHYKKGEYLQLQVGILLSDDDDSLPTRHLYRHFDNTFHDTHARCIHEFLCCHSFLQSFSRWWWWGIQELAFLHQQKFRRIWSTFILGRFGPDIIDDRIPSYWTYLSANHFYQWIDLVVRFNHTKDSLNIKSELIFFMSISINSFNTH